MLLRIDHTTSLYGGIGRYHSRATCDPPRPPGPPPSLPGRTSVRFIVVAPPLLNTSYIRIMALWLYDIDPRYPGDHASMKPCVHTPGMPYFVICAISKLANHGISP